MSPLLKHGVVQVMDSQQKLGSMQRCCNGQSRKLVGLSILLFSGNQTG